jgi:hypothetical protein
MLKLYRLYGSKKEYWETWEGSNGTHTVHWGELGTRGESKTVTSTSTISATDVIQKEIDLRASEGFAPVAAENHATLMIEYAIEGMGKAADLEKRHRLEDRMNETLGWTGAMEEALAAEQWRSVVSSLTSSQRNASWLKTWRVQSSPTTRVSMTRMQSELSGRADR